MVPTAREPETTMIANHSKLVLTNNATDRYDVVFETNRVDALRTRENGLMRAQVEARIAEFEAFEGFVTIRRQVAPVSTRVSLRWFSRHTGEPMCFTYTTQAQAEAERDRLVRNGYRSDAFVIEPAGW
jgi:hypothetical protein